MGCRAGDMQRCEEGCSGVLQELQDCGCSGLQALVHTQRAACRLLRSDLQGALDDCCAALAAEPGSPDALHLKYQASHPSHASCGSFSIHAATPAASAFNVHAVQITVAALQCGEAQNGLLMMPVR